MSEWQLHQVFLLHQRHGHIKVYLIKVIYTADQKIIFLIDRCFLGYEAMITKLILKIKS